MKFRNCSSLDISFAEPMFLGFANFLLVILISIVLISAVFSMWIAPVSGPITKHEQKNKLLNKGSFLILTYSLLTLLLVSLILLFFPVSCTKNAFLVSASNPQDTHNWKEAIADFKDNLTSLNSNEQIQYHDLSGMRDGLLRVMQHKGITVIPTDEGLRSLIANEISIALDIYPDVVGESLPSFDTEKISSALIETIELGIIMAWRSRFYTENQKINYLVTNRAERFGWNWTLVSNALMTGEQHDQTGVRIKEFYLQTQQPFLDQIISVSGSLEDQPIRITAVFVPNNGGKIKLALTNGNGANNQSNSLYGSVEFDISAADAGERVIKTLAFNIDNLAPGKPRMLVQTIPFLAERELPRPLPGRLDIYVTADLEEHKTVVEDTISGLLSSKDSCNIPNAGEYDYWLNRISQFYTPSSFTIVSEREMANVIYYLRQDGSVWIIPANSIDKTLPINNQSFDSVLGIPFSESNLIKAVVPREDVAVLIEKDHRNNAFSFQNLGFFNYPGLQQINTELISAKQTLSATPKSKDKLGVVPLGLNEFSSNSINFLKAEFAINSMFDNQLLYKSTLFAPNTIDTGFYCGLGITSNADLFYSYWYGVLKDFVEASLPETTASEGNFLGRDGAPIVLFDFEARKEQSNKRYYYGAILLFLAFIIYFTWRIFLLTINLRK